MTQQATSHSQSRQAPLPIAAIASCSSVTPLLVVASGSSLILQSGSSSQTVPPASTSTDEVIPLVRHIAISADGAHIATASDDKLLRVYTVSSGSATLVSTRSTSKKCSDLCFAPSTGAEPSILYSDKVGDVYVYPYTPRTSTGERPTTLAIQSDPTLNPDADLLLGHVSVLTASVLSPCGNFIITSDRDEHIRVSRFPKSFIIERYLFGSDGFISALHIPESAPSTLISAGGEQWMRIWDWKMGKETGKVDIYPSVMSHRRARSNYRRVKRNTRNVKREKALEADEVVQEGIEGALTQETFYVPPEGYTLPTGEGVCVKKIRTISLDGQTYVIFFSEGAAALHSFLLPSDRSSSPPTISTLPFDTPVLDFTLLPSLSSTTPQIVVSLDSTWGTFRQNAPAGSQCSAIGSPSISPETETKIATVLVVAELSQLGLMLIPSHPILASLQPEYTLASASSISKLQLYPLLPLLPRWAGMEEDDELAGPANAPVVAPNSDTKVTAAEAEDGASGVERRDYTPEELSQMGNKMLGRLKSQGVDVDEYMKKKTRKPRSGTKAKKRKLQAGAEGDGYGEEVDIEAQMNEA